MQQPTRLGFELAHIPGRKGTPDSIKQVKDDQIISNSGTLLCRIERLPGVEQKP